MKISKRARMQREFQSHGKFMQDRGDSLAGYIQFYARFNRPATQAEAIYTADVAFHAKLEEQLAAMPNR